MNSEELHDHVFTTYTNLRIGIGVIALAFPLILWLFGLAISNIPLQGSLSHYFHTPMRTIFVGVLFAIGVFLYLYKGYSVQENYALNFAGIFAATVAIFPMDFPSTAEMCAIQWPVLIGSPITDKSLCTAFTSSTLHGASALLFFGSIAYVCIFRASDTLHLISDEKRRKRYNQIYKVLGIGMLVFPLGAWAAAYFLNPGSTISGFVVESVAIWNFGLYWIVKSTEIKATHADRDALSLP